MHRQLRKLLSWQVYLMFVLNIFRVPRQRDHVQRRRGPEAQVRHAPVTPLQVRGRLRDHQADPLQHQQNCE